jgi:hypothetical protein
VAQNRQIFSRVILAYSALIFPKGDVENPVNLILNFPMTTLGFQNPFRIGRQTGNEITGLYLNRFTNLSLRNDPDHAFQPFPLLVFP